MAGRGRVLVVFGCAKGGRMNIYAPPGSEVRYLDKNGYDIQRENAKKAGLVKGEIYIVSDIEVGRSSSVVFLEGFKDGFNTVMFRGVRRNKR